MSETRAIESGHFYDRKTGEPRYTIIGKNGVERNTTLRDARKNDWVVGVTTIISLAAAPALEVWKQDQLLMACLTTDRIPEEIEKDYIARIKQDAQEQSKKARELGTAIHAKVQDGFEKGSSDIYYQSARNCLVKELNVNEWITEKSFATDRYGGKIDLQNDEYILDLKTSDKSLEDVKLWDNHYLQLAAYRMGRLKECEDYIDTQCGILFINTITAESKLVMAEEDKLDRGWFMFKALVDFYYAKSGL